MGLDNWDGIYCGTRSLGWDIFRLQDDTEMILDKQNVKRRAEFHGMRIRTIFFNTASCFEVL